MKLTDLSVHRPVGVVIIVIAVMILGAISLTNLSIDLLPDINLPVAVVMTSYSGAAPQEVETLVTRPLEGGLSTLEGLERIQSLSVQNQSLIILVYDFGTNMDQAMLEIRERLDLIRQALPDGADDPALFRFDPNAFPIIQLSLSGSVSEAQLTSLAEERVIPRLERLPGVAQVSLIGQTPREIHVEVDPHRLAAYQLNLLHIVQLLGTENVSTSAGTLPRGQMEMSLRVIGELQDSEDVRGLPIPLPTGEVIRLEDVAEVKDTTAPTQSYAFVNGQPTLSLNITKQSDANTVAVARAVERELEKLAAELPSFIEINTILDTSQFIRESINNVVRNMILGASMAVFILLVFLRSVHSTLVIAASIPIALISAFTLIYFSGQTLNILTMGGLALGIGLMVDSSIVILENIYKYRERGFHAVEAAKRGAQEIGSAVIASTLTSVVVFLPIIFTTGLAAEIFFPLAITVAFTLLASLAVAITLVPMLASRLMPPSSPAETQGWLTRLSERLGSMLALIGQRYRQALNWAIGHRKTVLVATLLLLGGCLTLVPSIGVEFLPILDQGEILVEVELPVASSLEHTVGVLAGLEQQILDIAEVELVFTSAGQDNMAMRGNAQNRGSMYIRLLPADKRERSTTAVMEELRQLTQSIPDAEVTVSRLDSTGMDEAPVRIEISGHELDTLAELAEEVSWSMAQVPGLANIITSLEQSRPELQVIIDKDLASQYGLTQNEVMQTIRLGFQGQVATVIRKEGEEINVRVLLSEQNRQSVEDLAQLPLVTPLGDSITLNTIARFEQTEGPPVISRQNQQRGVAISADLTTERDLGSVVEDIRRQLEEIPFPEGYQYEFGGQYEQMIEAFGDLTLALGLAVFLVYAVMAVQFEKLMYPFIIMFSLPVTSIGVIVGLFVTGHSFSTPAFIGLIVLAGIVVNNAIVLVDYTNTLRQRGLSREDALLTAGQERLRPIMMTMLTTVLAMAPLALGLGEGAELQAPMAVVIVFGLSFSTLITLFVVPVMYIYMDRLTEWFKRRLKQRKKLLAEPH
ncbi:efflux RND transporter permease subunit [Caldalkalibacillus thermarum TA2.A1]|uniref:Efflux RND transporter permease subunit n=1 Tax=Caldalkalibacillus thermarum (strain TA2.A1) TaxID=986075 RepID=A0A8X8I9G3_CALTT|nr:efflux RND transporter permease subunit [Caldalkalibacillus thermarum]QZT33431.1 efflux RND transporter permease subunit [Caldalkalibacillus thermarum TA2.A1]